ncbi:MAG: hypothetical protein N2109_05655 [Fimbriimonadales bacterium]|nr:hypothetical protein [Fimbriimonadales bacterium]
MLPVARRLVLALCAVAATVLGTWSPRFLVAIDAVPRGRAEPEARAHGFVEAGGREWSEIAAQAAQGPTGRAVPSTVFLPPDARPARGLDWRGADRLLVRVAGADGSALWLAARRLAAREAMSRAPADAAFPLRRWAPLALACGLLAWGWIPWPRRARESVAPHPVPSAVVPDLLALFFAVFLIGLALLVLRFGLLDALPPAATTLAAALAAVPSLWIWVLAAWHEALELERASPGEYVLRWLGGSCAFRASEVVSVEAEELQASRALGCLAALGLLAAPRARAALLRSHPVIRIHRQNASLHSLPVEAAGWGPMLARMRDDAVRIDPSAWAAIGVEPRTLGRSFSELRPPRLRLAAAVAAALLVLAGLLAL